MWNHTFDELKVNANECACVVITGVSRSKHKREEIIKTLFETFGVQNCYIANSAAMSLFSSGRTTGLVVKSGECVTQAIPVFEG